MASLLYSRKRKCGLRRGPQFRLWLWCITIQCSLCLPSIFAKCQGIENLSLAVYPEGMIKVPYGKPVEIFCVDDKYTADDLDFALGGVSEPSEKLNGTTRRLYKEMHEKGVFAYYCLNKETKKLCTSRVLVDSAPLNVTDFGCKSRNLDELYCSWTAPDGFSITNYSLTFITNGQVVGSCKARKNGTRHYCSWTTNSQPRYRQLEKQFFFNLKFFNAFGSNEQNFTVDHFSIVKPAEVNNLKVIGNGTHSVLLQWSIPNNMVDLLPNGVVHKIEYQIAKIDNTSYFRSVDASSLPRKNRTYRFLLSDLPYAHMQYEVRIYIRPVEATRDEFWSKHSYVAFYTASERPKRPPETVAGAFDQSSYESKRRIYVYWKQLEEYEEAGANFTYKVVAHESSKNPETLLADSKKRSFVILDPASLGPINIQIWSMNDNGSSINNTHLYIPPMKDTESLRVPSFTKLAYENGTYKLSWVGVEKINNYTLFWCQHNTTKICTGRMNFTVLNPEETEHVIDLPRENRYQFAISANKGAKTSGMVWATCDISKDGIPMYGFPVKVNHGVPGKSFVIITWTMACTLQEGIITGYLISYCPVKDTSNLCDETFENKSSIYISDPKQKEINITNLKPYRTYLFSLALNTTYGLKTIENASTGVTTTEDTPTSPRNVTITDVQNDSLVISWYPPLHKNGIIGKYVIYNYSNEFYIDKVPENDKDMGQRQVTLQGLHGFQNYSWSIVACNTAIGLCSQNSPPNGIFVRTRIGPPSKLRSPKILNSPDEIKWDGPEKPGGTVDLYQIMRIKDEKMPGEIFNTTNLSFSLIHCEGGVAVEKYQVRAVNFDEDPNFGVLTDRIEVGLPKRQQKGLLEYPGEWSEPSTVACRSRDGLTMTFIMMAVFALAGIMYVSTKFYKKYRKMEDIKPVLPDGLGIPEKDISKYAFGGWNPTNKDEKPSSDEMLLLPNSRGTTVSTDTKQKDVNNCGSSDHTDSTVLSETSRGQVDRQASTSDDGSESSLRLEMEAVKGDCDNVPQNEEDSSNSDSEPSRENSPYFSNKEFKINPASGYVQQPAAVNPASGYVQSAPAPPTVKSSAAQPASSSYVMAALSPPIFTTGVAPPSLHSNPHPSSGYVRPEDAHLSRSMLNFANPNLSPTKLFGPESLPIMPTLPTPAKHGADSSYIQLQSLDSLPSHKTVRSNVPLKQPASNGYVSPGDAVINKHLNNMLSAGQLAEESAMIDPMMSPDAYCRFSWSTDPANDNLHSLLADSPTIKPSKN